MKKEDRLLTSKESSIRLDTIFQQSSDLQVSTNTRKIVQHEKLEGEKGDQDQG